MVGKTSFKFALHPKRVLLGTTSTAEPGNNQVQRAVRQDEEFLKIANLEAQ